jgi:hypothetical protein
VQAEGRKVDVINAGTEGYSTDQEVLWFSCTAASSSPTLVVLCPYENDLYWNAKTDYDRYPKPGSIRPASGRTRPPDPGRPPARTSCALGGSSSHSSNLPELVSPERRDAAPDGVGRVLQNDPRADARGEARAREAPCSR